MKTWHKRGLAYVLTAAMLMGSVPTNVFAAENTAVEMLLEDETEQEVLDQGTEGNAAQNTESETAQANEDSGSSEADGYTAVDGDMLIEDLFEDEEEDGAAGQISGGEAENEAESESQSEEKTDAEAEDQSEEETDAADQTEAETDAAEAKEELIFEESMTEAGLELAEGEEEPDANEESWDVWFKDLRNGDGTWIYDNETMTLKLATEKFPEVEYQVEWQVGILNNETNEIDTDNSVPYTVNEDNISITLKGEDFTEELNTVSVRAIIKTENETDSWEEVSRAETYVFVKEASYEYYYPYDDRGDNEVLPGWEVNIDNGMDCWAEDANHVGGGSDRVKITELSAEWQIWDEEADADENNEKWVTGDQSKLGINLNKDEDENPTGWTLWGEDYGRMEITLTYQRLDGDPEAKDNTHTFHVYVNGDAYELTKYYENGVEQLLPGNSITVETSLVHRWYHG